MPPRIVQLESAKVRRFLEELRDQPFMAVTFNEDGATLYVKGLDQTAVERIIHSMAGLDQEGSINASGS